MKLMLSVIAICCVSACAKPANQGSAIKATATSGDIGNAYFFRAAPWRAIAGIAIPSGGIPGIGYSVNAPYSTYAARYVRVKTSRECGAPSISVLRFKMDLPEFANPFYTSKPELTSVADLTDDFNRDYYELTSDIAVTELVGVSGIELVTGDAKKANCAYEFAVADRLGTFSDQPVD